MSSFAGTTRVVWVLYHLLALVLSACTRTYPYLITSEDCNCERYRFRDTQRHFTLEVRASYQVRDRIRSQIEITFRNESNDTLDLSQAFIKGTSQNVRYQYNGKPQPLPFMKIQPGGDYSLMLSGEDTEVVDEPWHRIAGERVILEITRLILGSVFVPPIVITLVPVNPKFSS